MRKGLFRHVVVRLNRAGNVLAVNTNSHTHQHVLWTFGHFAVNAQKIGTLQRLKPKEVVMEVAFVDNC